MEPSSTDLKYFIETIRAGSISRSAENLGITQPSLSLAIKRIERYLDQPIFIRNRNGVRLTLAGEKLREKSVKLFKVWEDVRTQCINPNEISGTIHFGCHPEVAIDSLPLFLPMILSRYPDIRFQMTHDISRNITEKVISSKLDIAIVVNPVKHPDLIIKVLTIDEMNLWSSKKKTKMNNPENPIVICDENLHQSQKVLKLLSRKSKIKQIIHSSDLEVIASLVASGCGLGVLPSEVAYRNKGYKLEPVKLVKGIEDKVCLVYRVENKKNGLIKLFVDEIISSHGKYYEF